MSRETIAKLLLSSLAADRRVIVADWRFHVHYFRIARANGYRLPDIGAVRLQIRKLIRNGDMVDIPGVHGVYRVTVPYASAFPAPDEAIIQESNPTAVFSHFTAIAHHGLTDEIPDSIFATVGPRLSRRLPLGTTPDDWIDVRSPPRRKPEKIRERAVVWSQAKDEWEFGDQVGYLHGTAVYVTDLERTLLDALRSPDKCGGISEVFHAWKRAIDDVSLDRLLGYVDRFDQQLMRQRTGYLLEELGREDPRLDAWAANAQRGSSAKLVASEAFSPTHSERWGLSINVPDSAHSQLRD